MSYTPGSWECDICGSAVSEREMVTLSLMAGTDVVGRRDLSGYIGHYHLTCWKAVDPAITDAAVTRRDEVPGVAGVAEVAKWKRLSIPEREALLHQALGDRHRTTSELAEKMSELRGAKVYTSEAAALVARMWKAGLLAREAEPFQGKLRYRYFHPAELSGTIAELERALSDPGAKDHDMSEGA